MPCFGGAFCCLGLGFRGFHKWDPFDHLVAICSRLTRLLVNQFTTETGGRGEYSPHLHNVAMGQIRSRRLDTWDCCSRELVARQSRIRLRRYPRSPFVYVRELV